MKQVKLFRQSCPKNFGTDVMKFLLKEVMLSKAEVVPLKTEVFLQERFGVLHIKDLIGEQVFPTAEQKVTLFINGYVPKKEDTVQKPVLPLL